MVFVPLPFGRPRCFGVVGAPPVDFEVRPGIVLGFGASESGFLATEESLLPGEVRT